MGYKTHMDVYIETSIVSYLTARPSGDLLAAAWQRATLDWWETQRTRFDLYTSDVTVNEAAKGDSEAAARRLEALSASRFWLLPSQPGIYPSRLWTKAPCLPEH